MPTYLDSLNQVLHQLCATDPTVYIIGEDIVDPYGGAFKVTRGLSTRYPDRVLTTPVSEGAIVGMAGGMALRGLRPIVEIMFGDFMTLCADQLINHIAKYRAMYAGQTEVPVVIRTPMGGGRGYGPTHSQSLEKLFLGIPHLNVVAPSLFHDPGELLRTVVADPGPVLFIEHKLLYPNPLLLASKLTSPLRLDWLGGGSYPIARVANYGTGNPDVTLITYGGNSRNLERLLRKLAQDEIRTLCLLPSLINHLEVAPLVEAVASANAGCIIWEEGSRGFDWGSEVIAQLQAHLGTSLGPVHRIASEPAVIPAARYLEKQVIPGVDSVEQAIVELLRRSLVT